MEKPGPKHLRLGDRIDGTILKQNGGRRFEVRSRAAPQGWRVELHTLRPEEIELGAGGSFWVAKVSPLHRSILVQDGDYGRLPISDTMRSRYLAAIRGLLGHQELTPDLLADAQSMVARIEQRNHADWLTVWQMLGEPETGDVKMLLAAITAIRLARKQEPDKLSSLLAEFGLKYGEPLEIAGKRLAPKSGRKADA